MKRLFSCSINEILSTSLYANAVSDLCLRFFSITCFLYVLCVFLCICVCLNPAVLCPTSLLTKWEQFTVGKERYIATFRTMQLFLFSRRGDTCGSKRRCSSFLSCSGCVPMRAFNIRFRSCTSVDLLSSLSSFLFSFFLSISLLLARFLFVISFFFFCL